MSMEKELSDLVNAIKADYAARPYGSKQSMMDAFNNSISISEGKKYIKIVTGGSVWGFIVKDDDGKFKRGDILKAAGWATPAKNSARGNIIDGDYKIFWTGPAYLR